MKFDLELFENPPIVQKKKKYAHFTVREIGGPAEIIKWREEQARKEAEQNIRISLHRDALKDLIAPEGSPEGTEVTWKGRATAGRQAWGDRVREARMRASPFEGCHPTQHPAWKPREAPKLSLFRRVAKWAKGIFESANFN